MMKFLLLCGFMVFTAMPMSYAGNFSSVDKNPASSSLGKMDKTKNLTIKVPQGKQLNKGATFSDTDKNKNYQQKNTSTLTSMDERVNKKGDEGNNFKFDDIDSLKKKASGDAKDSKESTLLKNMDKQVHKKGEEGNQYKFKDVNRSEDAKSKDSLLLKNIDDKKGKKGSEGSTFKKYDDEYTKKGGASSVLLDMDTRNPAKKSSTSSTTTNSGTTSSSTSGSGSSILDKLKSMGL